MSTYNICLHAETKKKIFMWLLLLSGALCVCVCVCVCIIFPWGAVQVIL